MKNNTVGNKEIITKMRPDPDFHYLAVMRGSIAGGESLERNIKREPGEIPGFYAKEHRE